MRPPAQRGDRAFEAFPHRGVHERRLRSRPPPFGDRLGLLRELFAASERRERLGDEHVAERAEALVAAASVGCELEGAFGLAAPERRLRQPVGQAAGKEQGDVRIGRRSVDLGRVVVVRDERRGPGAVGEARWVERPLEGLREGLHAEERGRLVVVVEPDQHVTRRRGEGEEVAVREVEERHTLRIRRPLLRSRASRPRPTVRVVFRSGDRRPRLELVERAEAKGRAVDAERVVGSST